MLKLIAMTAVTAAVLVSPASAKNHAWQIGNDTVHLHYAPLDTKSVAGRRELLLRVERAADLLCREDPFPRRCILETVADTSRQPRAVALRVALNERDGSNQLAAR